MNNPRPAKGAIKNMKRIGRGPGSGHGKTSTRGANGAGSRSGNKARIGFEGGQMPKMRIMPKVGFHSPFRVEYEEINVSRLEDAAKAGKLSKGQTITPALLRAVGIISGGHAPVKILGDGTLSVALTIQAHKVTKGAQTKIEAAGGKVELVTAA
jgi:large subunit ribosomal protein L15